MKSNKRRDRPERPIIEQIPPQPTGNSKFVRALGSVDPLTRKKAVNALQRWLQMRHEVAEADLITIWKGLFFCYWHSDLAPVQEELADQLGGLLPTLHAKVAHCYFSTFLLTMRREWFTIDRHRMDKFMNLVRRFIYYLFVLLNKSSWRTNVVEQYLRCITDDVMLAKDGLLSIGVSYHLCDVWLAELQAALGTDKLTDAVARQVLQPFVETMARTNEQPLITRIMDSVIEPLAEYVIRPQATVRPDVDSDDEEVALEHMSDDEAEAAVALDAFQDLEVVAFAEALFEKGANAEVAFRNRTALYQCHERLCQAAKQRQLTTQQMASEQPRRNGIARKRQKLAELPQDVPIPEAVLHQAEPVMDANKDLAHNKHHVQHVHMVNGAAAGIDVQSGGKRKKRKAVKDQWGHREGPDESPAAKANGQAVAGHTLKGDQQDRQHTKQLDSNNLATHSITQQQHTNLVTTNGLTEATHDKGYSTPTKQAKSKGLGNGPSSAANPTSPAAQPVAPNSSPAIQDTGPKSVRFNLKDNLVFPFGGPVPPADVRTPPGAKPKGSALKVRGKGVRLDLAKKMQKQKRKKKGVVDSNGTKASAAAGVVPSVGY